MAKLMGLFISSRTRLIGRGLSRLYALTMSFDLECWVVQWTSQSPQPMQASCLAIIRLIIISHSFCFDSVDKLALNVKFCVFVKNIVLFVVVCLDEFLHTLHVFKGINIHLFFGC